MLARGNGMDDEADKLAAALYQLAHSGRCLRSADDAIAAKRSGHFPWPTEEEYALAYSDEPLVGDAALNGAWPNILRRLQATLRQWRTDLLAATAALKALPKELVDDTDRPPLERWSAKLSRLLIEAGDEPIGAAMLPLPANWSEQIEQLAGYADELLAIVNAGTAAQPATAAAGEPQATGKDNRNQQSLDNSDSLDAETRAIAILAKCPKLGSIEEVAAMAGCSRQYLSNKAKCPRFAAVWKVSRNESTGKTVRGSKSKNGELEAWE